MVVKMVVRPIAKLSKGLIRCRPVQGLHAGRVKDPSRAGKSCQPCLEEQPCSWSLQRIASNSSGQPGGQHASCTGPELRHQREQCEVTAAATPNISVAFCFPATPASTRTLKTVTDPLPGWRDGRAKQAIVGFVRQVRGEDGSESVPAEGALRCSTMTAPCGVRSRYKRGPTAAARWSGWRRSAAAAAAPRRHRAPAETLAKLTWSIHHTDLPDWAERIGRSVGDHRRGRDGRHPLPGHRGAVYQPRRGVRPGR